jgi:Cu(I)/Ag(I) efflux system membrane fusion protein
MTRSLRIGWILAAVIASLATLGIGYRWGASRALAPPAPAPAAPAQKVVLYWYDPMVPDQHFDKPGKSPFMDMQLVPKYASATDSVGGVAIAPGVRQNLGIRTVLAKRGRLPGALRVPGTIGWNLREEQVISVPVEAVVERLYVRTPFEPVHRGQPLLRLRAPAWSAALAESQALRTARSGAARELQASSGPRLRALGLPAGARADASGGIVIVAPDSAVLSEIAVREGQATPAGTLLLRLNGTGSVWVDAAMPQGASAGVAIGTPVQVTVDAVPGRSFEGRIEALLPQIDAGTRTQRTRIVLDNADGLLRPGMFAQVSLQADPGVDRVLVPSGAVIADGTQTRLIVLGADDRFVPVAVRLGGSGGGMTEILSGLSGGERVVASGQFLIESEASLSGALQRLSTSAPTAVDPPHDDGAHAAPSHTAPAAPPPEQRP